MNTPRLSRSSRVRAEDFESGWLPARAGEMGESLRLHRKLWEFAVIAQVYLETIGAGGSALGFGCGREPLPAWLANRGCRVLATDLAEDEAVDWTPSQQHSGGLADLPFAGICEEAAFRERVTFSPLNMRELPPALVRGEFDFTWSCGSFEHIGGIEPGLRFFLQQMGCLRPGGVAVHTTEYNFASNDRTINAHNLVLFRQRDFERLERRLRAQGDTMWPLDLEPGTGDADRYVDPYLYQGETHLSLAINDHVSTSIVLVARRGDVAAGPSAPGGL